MVTDVLVAFDHLRHEVTILANVFVEDDVERGLRRGASRRSPTCASGWRRRCRAPTPAAASRPRSSRNIGSEGYAAAVERVQGVHPRGRRLPGGARASAGAPDCPVEAFSIYRGLRAVNPSPYMYFLDFERLRDRRRLARVAGQGRRADRAEQRPIAGTRPRGGHGRGGHRSAPRSCSPTRRSAPST